MKMKYLAIFVLLGIGVVPVSAQSVRMTLEGRLTVKPELDPAQNFAGFHVLVAYRAQESAQVDTLGFAVTDAEGKFSMPIQAAEKGIYPVLISRRGQQVAKGEMIVSEGDTARLDTSLPTALLRINSRENAAWLALRNILAQHKQNLVEIVSKGQQNGGDVKSAIALTANLLWDLEGAFGANPVGVQLAKLESVMMLLGWNDSLAVARSKSITPEISGYVDLQRNLRRANARVYGQEAAIASLRSAIAHVPEAERQAPLYAEIVMARLDSLQAPQAMEVLHEMKQKFPSGKWASFITNAEYEAQYMMPGMPAPDFNVTTIDQQTFKLSGMRGQYALVEFWSPRDSVYPQQLSQVMEVVRLANEKKVTWISIALEPDRSVFETFRRNREMPPLQVLEAEGTKSPVSKAYNVNYVPVRYLIGPDGKIVGKYLANGLGRLADDLNNKIK